MLEHAELFTRKAGEEIVDQLYHFEIHNRHLSLRPEFTPSLARMVRTRAGSARFPLRWYSIPQCWRYERMARGRRREHYQWNLDIWGETSVKAEAELISAIFSALKLMGVQSSMVQVRLNSRTLLEEMLAQTVLQNRPEVFAPLCIIIDKLDKIGPEMVTEQLMNNENGPKLARSVAEEVVSLLSIKSLEDVASLVPPNSKAIAELRMLFQLLDSYGYSDYVIFDASVVRGLAYYTGIVFETFDVKRKFRSICGGGRYDKLLETLGGPSIPAVGFGFGDSVIIELLKEHGLLPEFKGQIHGFVLGLGNSEHIAAIKFATKLRAQGKSVELATSPMRVRKALNEALRIGAECLYVIGPEELSRGVARVRKIATKIESEIPLE